mmetsp:Transcript_13246/g.36599  ORF Transcript_13246/g.36599 Transcript_13246/m.36599 type:complete len:224 (+) Transcript_13246:154-825(+)
MQHFDATLHAATCTLSTNRHRATYVGVNVLSDLGLMRGIDEELEELHVGRVLLEVASQRLVDEILQKESIVDAVVLRDVRVLVPAGAATSRDAAIHDVVGHEEERLQPLHLPSQDGGIKQLLLGQGASLENFHAAHDRQSARHLAAGHGGLEALRVVRRQLFLEGIAESRQFLEVADQLLLQLREHLQECLLVHGPRQWNGVVLSVSLDRLDDCESEFSMTRE